MSSEDRYTLIREVGRGAMGEVFLVAVTPLPLPFPPCRQGLKGAMRRTSPLAIAGR